MELDKDQSRWTIATLNTRTAEGRLLWEEGANIGSDPENRKFFTAILHGMRITYNPADLWVSMNAEGLSFIARDHDDEALQEAFDTLYRTVAIPIIEARKKAIQEQEAAGWQKVQEMLKHA